MTRSSICARALVLAAISALCASAHGATPASNADESSPQVEAYLNEGRLAAGEAALEARLQGHSGDDQALFSLGVVRVLRAAERLMQSLHRYGMRSQPGGMPFVRLPVPPNPNPEELSYEDARAITQRFVDDLAEAEATLAEVDDPQVKLPLRFGRIRMDFNGDGEAETEEAFWRIYQRTVPGLRISQKQAEQFVVCLDRGDVDWLRGYCHLLMGLGEMDLAYNERELFERTAHILFPRIDTPFEFLAHERSPFRFNRVEISDAIAFIHLLNFPVGEPGRMQAALKHFEQVIQLSRSSWSSILAETDDDHEWVPNPKQTGVIPGVQVTQEVVDAWHELLDEVEALLAGKKLIPFWRGDPTLGVNLRRVFTDPRRLDLVLWVQGTGAAPYLEEGVLTRPEFWRRLGRGFRGNLVGFAFWFN